MGSLLMDLVWLVLAFMSGTTAIVCARLAWHIIRHRPTQMEITQEKRRRKIASVFRRMSKEAKP